MGFNQYFHIACESLFTICCLGMIVYAFRTRKSSEGPAKAIIALLIADSVMNMSDAMDFAFRGVMTNVGHLMVSFANFFLYISGFALIFFASMYVGTLIRSRGEEHNRIVMPTIYILCGIGILLVILSRPFHFYYFIDEHNVYERTSSFWIHMAIAELAGVMLMIRVIQNHRLLKRREMFASLCFCILPVLASIIQSFHFGVSLNVFALFISVVLVVTVYKWTILEKVIAHEVLKLTGENIDLLSSEMEQFMIDLDIDIKTRLRTRLKIEESLLRIKDKFGQSVTINFLANMPFGKPKIRMEYYGEAFNPLMRTEDGIEDWSAGLLNRTGISPNYSFFAGRNVLKFSLPTKRLNPAFKALITVLIGLLTGYVGSLILSKEGEAVLMNEVFTPAYEVFVNILYCVASPIIFLMLVTTILNTGAISEQGGNSASILRRYLGLSIAMAFVALVVSSAIFGLTIQHEHLHGKEVAEFTHNIVHIVPENLIDPFINVNTPQLILMSMVIGFAILALGNRGKDLANVMRQANMAAMKLAEWISRLIPYFGFVVVALITLSDKLDLAVRVLIVLLIAIVMSFAFAAIMVKYVSIRKKVSFTKLVKKCLASFLMAIKTGSTSAAYGSAEECCTRRLGIEDTYADESLPLGSVLYMPANDVGAVIFIVFAAYRSELEPTVVWCLLAVVLSVILIAATPPIPGANFLAYMVMIPQLGLNEDFIVMVVIFEVFYGPFAVAANQLMLQMEITLQADSTGLLDKGVLKS